MTESSPIDLATLDSLRLELGTGFMRQVDDFREDGAKCVVALEEAVRAKSAVAMVRPAHSLREDAIEFGAPQLTELTERIEAAARAGVDADRFPLEVVEDVLKLRTAFNTVVATLVNETSTASAIWRAMGLGRRPPANV